MFTPKIFIPPAEIKNNKEIRNKILLPAPKIKTENTKEANTIMFILINQYGSKYSAECNKTKITKITLKTAKLI